MKSAIYTGSLYHARYAPTAHHFSYDLYMLALDLDELDTAGGLASLLGTGYFSPLSFRREDYLDGSDQALKPAVLEKVNELGGAGGEIDSILLVCQVRCLGFYFSPINMYFCYTKDTPCYLLAEVNNTPWGERHHYLVDLKANQKMQKDFHVSPFMPMDVQYHWRIIPPDLSKPDNSLAVVIDIRRQQSSTFTARLELSRQASSRRAFSTTLVRWPCMTFSIVCRIYWQALRLFLKSTPVFSHPGRNKCKSPQS